MATKTLKRDTPLSKLNDLFPAGIPTVTDEPNLMLYDQPCWELDLHSLTQPQLQQIAAIVMQDIVPLSITTTLLSTGIVAIPQKWVLHDCNQN